MKGIAILALLATAVTLAGCGTTKASGHLNPTHAGYRLTHVAVSVEPRTELSDQVEVRLVDALTSRGIHAFKTSDFTRFATSDEEIKKQFAAQGGSESLHIVLQEQAGMTVGGAMSKAYVVGNTTSTTTTPVGAYNRLVSADIAVYTYPNDKAALVMQGAASRDGVGLYSAGDGSVIPGIVDGVMESLEAADVVAR